MCAYINKQWCHQNNITIKHKAVSPNLEIMTLGLRPYYLPREFSHVVLTVVYIRDRSVANQAREELTSHILDLETDAPDSLKIITGDFNHCSIKKTLPKFYQHITCETRENAILDLFHSNVRDSYTCTPLPPLGRSDHRLVHMRPRYLPVVQRQAPEKRTITQYTHEACEQLQSCFETTDWDMLVDTSDNVSEAVDVVTDYIRFCEDNIVPKKTIKIYANTKPWMNKKIKTELKKKSVAMNNKDKESKKSVQKELTKAIREGKDKYKEKIQEHFTDNNMKKVWEGMGLMSGYKRKKGGGDSGMNVASVEYANELNAFYCRFDKHDFTQERGGLRERLMKGREGEGTPVVTEEEVRTEFRRVHPKKAAGPDQIKPKILKTCADQLAGIFTVLFNLSFSQCIVPSIWKTSCIVPIPKKKPVSCLNDLRPVALTSSVIKVLERIVLKRLESLVDPFLDPLQFAYRRKRNAEDAVLYVLNKIYAHLDNANACIRLMFFDFSSAFNTIQCHLLLEKLIRMNVDFHTASWILDYLTDRPQFVRLTYVGNTTSFSRAIYSSVLFTNSGAPQGTVLSPFLFSLYTSDCRHSQVTCPIVKFADDTGMTGLITDDDDLTYRQEIDSFVSFCDNNFLELNVGKTKEMIIDFRRKKAVFDDILIKGQPVERVKSYKYLGIVLDDKLTWNDNLDHIVNKTHSRLYCLRKLRSFEIAHKILQMFFTSVVSSVMTFGLSCWGGNVTKRDRDRLDKIIKKAGGVVGRKQDDIQTIYKRQVVRKMKAILADRDHPLYSEFDSRLIERSGRFRVVKTKTTRHKHSFIPTAIQMYNEQLDRAKHITHD